MGSLSSAATESISIPRNVTAVDGPSSLAGAIRRPSSEHNGMAVLNASEQAEEVAGAQKKKSSR